MYNKKIQVELGKFKGDAVPIKNNLHKTFIERLRKQILSNESSSDTVDAESSDDNVCDEELRKPLEIKFKDIFANLDDDD